MRSVDGFRNTPEGFTLIELMIALVVVSVVIVGYVGANIMAQRNTEDMHERTVAIQDANRLIERMRSAGRDAVSFPADLVAEFPQYPDPITEFNEASQTEKPVFNNLTNEKTTVAYDNPGENPLDATITITWKCYTGRACSEAVRAYITQR